MERWQKVQVFFGFSGLGIIIAKWGLDTAFSESPEMFAVGRFSIVAAMYGVVVLYSLWKIFKPRWMGLPEY